MLDPSQKPAGTSYTITIAFLMAGLIFSPAVLLLSESFALRSIVGAVVCSAVCFALAWLNWTRASRLTIPTLESPDKRRP